MLADTGAFSFVVESFVAVAQEWRAESVVAIESRGFIFAAPVALALGLPLVLARKPGKLPRPTISVDYALEYGQGQLQIHEDAPLPGQRAVIIDDLVATGGTALAATELVSRLGGVVAGLLFVIELTSMEGRRLLQGHPVHSLVAYE